MAFGAMVRSPYAHARIKRIDTSRALALPGVVAVITAEELKPFKLHWMPTLAGDVQAVLADGKVSFQNQSSPNTYNWFSRTDPNSRLGASLV